MTRLGMAGALAALILAGIVWVRWDATQDARAAARAKGNEARIEHMENGANDATEIERSSDAALCDELGRVFGTGCPGAD